MDDVDFDDLRDGANAWLADTLKSLGCDTVGGLNLAGMRKAAKKDVLGQWLIDALIFVRQQSDWMQKLKNETEELKTKVIGSQEKVVELQSELLASKTEQLQFLQANVKATVEDSVKAEFTSYADAVSRTQTPIFAPEDIKAVVKHVVEEEDRSRSLMVFGLAEEADERVCDKISSLFQDIGEKPRIDACRLGKGSQGKPRPVKVTLSCGAVVNQILAKARNLRKTEQHKSVFMSPDRSPEQRAIHRDLVMELKAKNQEDTTKRHYIRGGKIYCSDRTVN